MLDNFSSNDSLLLQNLSSIQADFPHFKCYTTGPSSLIYIAYFITNILLLLPLCIFILYFGLQQWLGQGSGSTASMKSHSDCITYHLVTIELLGVLGFVLLCCSILTDHHHTFQAGYLLWTIPWYAETYCHILTCVERYLAVVHPITYLNLRNQRGIRIRNVCIGCVWLLSCGETGLSTLQDINRRLDMCLFSLFLIVMCFCSVSVLCVLIRPGPGEHVGERERVDQLKLRAYYTIVAILVVLLIRFVWNMTRSSMYVTKFHECVILAGGIWFNFPCSLLSPLLFLHRVGTFPCSRNTK